jgi:hypothetical protein
MVELGRVGDASLVAVRESLGVRVGLVDIGGVIVASGVVSSRYVWGNWEGAGAFVASLLNKDDVGSDGRGLAGTRELCVGDGSSASISLVGSLAL